MGLIASVDRCLTTLEENKGLVLRFIDEIQNAGRIELIEEIFAPDFVDHNPLPSFPPTRDGTKQMFLYVRKSFPDLHMVINNMIAEEDMVATRKTLHASHQGEYMGLAPTGKHLQMEVIDIFRIANGRLAEHWTVIDRLGMMEQLGATQRSPPT